MNWGGAPPCGLGEWNSSPLWTSSGQGRECSGWLLSLSRERAEALVLFSIGSMWTSLLEWPSSTGSQPTVASDHAVG